MRFLVVREMKKLFFLLATTVFVNVELRPATDLQKTTVANNSDGRTNDTREIQTINSTNFEALDGDLQNSFLVANHDNEIILTKMAPCPETCYCYAEIIAHCGPTVINKFPCDERTWNLSSDYVNAFSQKVQSIYLNFNNVKNIPENCLAASGGSLKTLSLRSNLINHLDVEAFNGLNRLEHLDLQENRITSITLRNQTDLASKPVSVFRFLRHSLLSLQLSFNQIGNISKEAFVGFQELQFLSLSHNQISWISLTAFKDLSNLHVLNLRGNPLNQVSRMQIGDILSSFSRPESSHGDYIATTSAKLRPNSECGSLFAASGDQISLRKKRQTAPSSDDFISERTSQEGSHKLKLETLDLGELNLTSVPENLPRSLKILFLDKNSISELFADSLAELTTLEALYLSHNHINQLTDGAFAFLRNLHLLDLSNNAIDRISPNALCGLQNLEILRLYKNRQLRQLPEKVFRHTKSLRLLYLQECGLETLPAGPWVYRMRVAWLYGNPFRCDCGTIVPLLVALKYKTALNNKRLLLDPYRKSSIDDLDVWEDMKKETTFCYSPPYYQERQITNLQPKELKCSLEEWKRIIVYRRLSVSMFYSDYPNDDPMGLSTSIDEPTQDPKNDTSQLEVKNHDNFNLLLRDYGLNKETNHNLDESVSNILKNQSSDIYDYGMSDLLNENEKQQNFQYSDKKDDIFQYYDDYQVEDTESMLGDSQNQVNLTGDSNKTSTATTEWLIEITASADVIDTAASSPETQEQNITPHVVAMPDTDQTELASRNIANFTNATDSSHNNAFLEATFDIDDEYDNQYWDEYDEQYFIGGVEEQSNSSHVDNDRHGGAKNSSTDPKEKYTDFESDYISWLDIDQWTSLKYYLDALDLYQEFDSYYYTNENTETEYGDIFSQLFNVTDKLSQYWIYD